MQIPLEIKWKKTIKHEDTLGLRAFMGIYPTKKAYLITRGVQEKRKEISIELPFLFKDI